MAFWNLKDATVTIGGSVVANHGLAEFDAEEKKIKRETMSSDNYPYPTIQIDGKKTEGSLKWAADSAEAFPGHAGDSTTLVVSGTGVYFSGNVILDNKKLTAGVDNKSSELSCTFETIDGDYTFENES